MKYPPAPLTPFLASPLGIRRRTHIPNEQRELKDHQPTLSDSIACRLLKISCLSFCTSHPLFSKACSLFCQNTGGGVPPRLSLVVYPERRSRGAAQFLLAGVFKNLRIPL